MANVIPWSVPSHPQCITSILTIPNSTAGFQRHQGVKNLPIDTLQHCLASSQIPDLWITIQCHHDTHHILDCWVQVTRKYTDILPHPSAHSGKQLQVDSAWLLVLQCTTLSSPKLSITTKHNSRVSSVMVSILNVLKCQKHAALLQYLHTACNADRCNNHDRSVCLSGSGVLSRWMKIRFSSFHCQVAQSF